MIQEVGLSAGRHFLIGESMEVQAPVLWRFEEPMALTRVTLDEPKQGEVRVRMVAAGVCHSPLNVARGREPDHPLPAILGDEGAGVVDAVGPGCDALRPGDHVVLTAVWRCGRCRACATGRPGLCERRSIFTLRDGTTRFRAGEERIYHAGPSTFSPYVVVDETSAVRIPPEMPLDKAALISCGVMTGVGAVLNAAGARPGDKVAIFGCGGIGMNAIQAAALTGASPIVAVDVSDYKLEAATRFGATHVVNANEEDVVERVKAITGGGTDSTIVAVGSVQAAEQGLATLAPTGTCVLVGVMPHGEALRVPPRFLLSGERRLVGCLIGSYDPHIAFPLLVELYLAKRLLLDELITTRYRPGEVNEAFRDLADGRNVRGLVVFD